MNECSRSSSAGTRGSSGKSKSASVGLGWLFLLLGNNEGLALNFGDSNKPSNLNEEGAFCRCWKYDVYTRHSVSSSSNSSGNHSIRFRDRYLELGLAHDGRGEESQSDEGELSDELHVGCLGNEEIW